MEFCPGIYEHAAALTGRTPWEVSRSASLLVEAHHAAWREYGHRLVVAGVDVHNIEPEALGAVVGEPSGNGVPVIVSHPCVDLSELAGLPSFDSGRGRFPIILEAASRLSMLCGKDKVHVPVCGPMALANGLLGMENWLMELMENPGAARRALDGLVSHQTGYLRAIRQAGARPLIFESGTTPPLISVAMFESIESAPLASLLDGASAIFGGRVPCIIGGDATPVARELFKAGPGYVIAPSETDQAAFLQIAGEFPGIHVRVNMQAALLGSEDWAAIEREARRAAGLAATRPNTSVGCGVVPFDTDPATLRRLRKLIESFSQQT